MEGGQAKKGSQPGGAWPAVTVQSNQADMCDKLCDAGSKSKGADETAAWLSTDFNSSQASSDVVVHES